MKRIEQKPTTDELGCLKTKNLTVSHNVLSGRSSAIMISDRRRVISVPSLNS